MNISTVLPIKGELQDKYNGCGLAVGAINSNGQLIDYIYITDIAPDLGDLDVNDINAVKSIKRVIIAIEKLLGDNVSLVLGMCSCLEFNIL